jgi:hypothetical protein
MKANKKLAKKLNASEAVAAKSEVFLSRALRTKEKLEVVRSDYKTLLEHFVRIAGMYVRAHARAKQRGASEAAGREHALPPPHLHLTSNPPGAISS